MYTSNKNGILYEGVKASWNIFISDNLCAWIIQVSENSDNDIKHGKCYIERKKSVSFANLVKGDLNSKACMNNITKVLAKFIRNDKNIVMSLLKTYHQKERVLIM